MLAILAAVSPLHADQGKASRSALNRGALAITGVTVIPMTGDREIRDATMLVRDGRIADIGAARSVRVPSDAGGWTGAANT